MLKSFVQKLFPSHPGEMMMQIIKRDILLSDNPAEDDSGREHGGVQSLFYRPCHSRLSGIREGSVTLEPNALFTEEAYSDVAPVTQVKDFLTLPKWMNNVWQYCKQRNSDISASKVAGQGQDSRCSAPSNHVQNGSGTLQRSPQWMRGTIFPRVNTAGDLSWLLTFF